MEDDEYQPPHDQIVNPDSDSALNDCTVEIINRIIPSCNLKFHLKDKVWFNDECRKAFLDKQEVYHLWNRNHSHLM